MKNLQVIWWFILIVEWSYEGVLIWARQSDRANKYTNFFIAQRVSKIFPVKANAW